MLTFLKFVPPITMALVFAVGAQAQGARQSVYVSPSGSDGSGAGTAAAPFATIAKGISRARAGGTVVLEPGIYRTDVTITKAVTLESDPSKLGAASKTIIDASGKINGILVQGPTAAGTVISGLTVEHALKAGILVVSTSRVVIENNIVAANDQSCAGFRGCFNPQSDNPAPVGTFTFTNTVPCGSPEFKKHPGMDCEALHLVGVSDSKVMANVVRGNLDGGIYLTDETGPTNGNLVAGNTVNDNQTDCAITLASHNPNAAGHPDKAGVYDNLVTHNAAINNGAAGIMMAGPMPGAASYHNTVTANIVDGNGMPGIEVHSHTPHQDMNGNVITDNFLSGNGWLIGDPDVGLKPSQTAGIVAFSAKAPLTGTVVKDNQIANERIGIWFSETVQKPANSGNRPVGSNVGTLVKIATAQK